MGNQNKGSNKDIGEPKADKENIAVVIEKEKNCALKDSAEGMFVLPSSTCCIEIREFVELLIGESAVLFLSGQDVTCCDAKLSMLMDLQENGCLYFVYDEKTENFKDLVELEDYIKMEELEGEKNLKMLVMPQSPLKAGNYKLKVFENCTIRQLELILQRISGKRQIKVYEKSRKLPDDFQFSLLKPYLQTDGILHLEYSYA